MKVETKSEEIVSNQSSNLRTVKFTVDVSEEEAIAQLINRLARLYTNPKQTMMFEYPQNGIDSMHEAGKADEPITITLPNKLNPFLIFRDTGIGMDHETVENIFSVANKSTKRDSNETIGGYGVGKLVFSPYCGVMFLTTWKHGEKTIYQCRLNDGRGEITEIHNEKSTEPQGVEIKIPIKEDDFGFFEERAKYSYSFFKTKPIIKGVKVELGYDTHIETEDFSILKDDIGVIKSGAYATIGGIPFPVDGRSIGWNYERRSIIDYIPLVLHFKVGEIDHTPSRDNLEYNEKTISAIKARIEEVKTYLSEYTEDEFKKCKTVHEARTNYKKFRSDNTKLSDIIKRFGLDRDFKFNGDKIKIHFSKKFFDDNQTELYSTELTKKHMLRTKKYSTDYNYGDKIIYVPFIFADAKRSKRIKKYMLDNGIDEIDFVTEKEEGAFDKLIKTFEIPSDYIINIEDLDDPVIDRSSTASGGYSSRAVRTTKCLELHDGCYPSGVDNWKEIDFDCENDHGIYTLIKYYKPVNLKKDDTHQSYRLEKVLKNLRSYDEDFKLIGVRTSEKNKVENNKNLIEFDNYLRSIMNKLEQEISVYKNITHNLNVRIGGIYAAMTATDVDCEILEFIDQQRERYNSARKKLLSTDMNIKYNLFETLCNYFGVNKLKHYKKRNSEQVVDRVEKAVKSFEKRFPLYQNAICNGGKIKNEYFMAMKMYQKSLTQQAKSSILSVS
jgi:hypothetical protein